MRKVILCVYIYIHMRLVSLSFSLYISMTIRADEKSLLAFFRFCSLACGMDARVLRGLDVSPLSVGIVGLVL